MNLFVFLCILKRRGRIATQEYFLMLLFLSNVIACCTSQAFLAQAVWHGLRTCETQITAALFGATGININLLSITAVTYDRMRRIFSAQIRPFESIPWLMLILISLCSIAYAAVSVLLRPLLLLPIFTVLTVAFYVASVIKLKRITHSSVSDPSSIRVIIPAHKKALQVILYLLLSFIITWIPIILGFIFNTAKLLPRRYAAFYSVIASKVFFISPLFDPIIFITLHVKVCKDFVSYIRNIFTDICF